MATETEISTEHAPAAPPIGLGSAAATAAPAAKEAAATAPAEGAPPAAEPPVVAAPAPPPAGRRRPSPEVVLRWATHALAMGLVLGAVWLARVDLTRAAAPVALPNSLNPLITPTPGSLATEPPPATAAPLPAMAALAAAPTAAPGEINRLVNLHTIIPSRPRYEVVKYVVENNDTLFIIADKFNLMPETILWGNAALADNPNILSVGMELNILPIDGALRVVQPGDTLENIASVFHGTVDEIVNFPGNDLDPSDPQLTEGQVIIIPGGWREPVVWQLPAVSRSGTQAGSTSGEPGACPGPYTGPTGTYTFVWPANNRYLSGTDFLPIGHPGLDIAAGLGAPLYTADTGVVVFAGVSLRGYGYLIIVDHGNGWQTAYAHLSQINVVCGQAVYQGNLIGLAGSTGNSTGPHLHFEMRHSVYGRVNPWLYLPPP